MVKNLIPPKLAKELEEFWREEIFYSKIRKDAEQLRKVWNRQRETIHAIDIGDDSP